MFKFPSDSGDKELLFPYLVKCIFAAVGVDLHLWERYKGFESLYTMHMNIYISQFIPTEIFYHDFERR